MTPEPRFSEPVQPGLFPVPHRNGTAPATRPQPPVNAPNPPWSRSTRVVVVGLAVALVLIVAAGVAAWLSMRSQQASLSRELTRVSRQASAAQAAAGRQPGVLAHLGVCFAWYSDSTAASGGALTAVNIAAPVTAANGTSSCTSGTFVRVEPAPRR